MDRKFSSNQPVVEIAIAIILLFVGLLLIAEPLEGKAQFQPSSIFWQNNPTPARNLVIVEFDVRDKTILFGDELRLLVTLQNRGKEPITIPPDGLILKNVGWTGYPGLGSGLGESLLVRANVPGNESFTLQPGESIALTGSNVEMAAKSIGPMRAEFIIDTRNETLLKAIGKPKEFVVSYYVAPSKLITSAWAAKTSEDRQLLQPQIRELLLVRSNSKGWRDRFYVDGTLTFMGCYGLPLLESAMKDSDPVVREHAVLALSGTPWAAADLNFFVGHLLEKKEGRDWAASVGKCDEDHALKESIRLAIAGLSDQEARVRIAAISVLTERASRESLLRQSQANLRRSRQSISERDKQIYNSVGLIDPALPLIQNMALDTNPGVRSEAQKFLSYFASSQTVAGNVADSLGDPDSNVRNQALQALRSSREPPPMDTIERAFASVKGDVALGLIEMIFEREDSKLAERLWNGFKERTVAERLMILTAITGHTDDAALNLVESGLKDGDALVQRAALMRLLYFPGEKASSLIKTNSNRLLPDVQNLAVAVEKELESRAMFPFLARGQSWATETIFPSREGTNPVVSPDGKWVAYVETGWSRPGGSGGMGRSNLLSLVHVVGSDGSSDRIVSDMFLVGWMTDSRQLASARDGFAAIVNLDGKVVAEFGDHLDKQYSRVGIDGEVWPTGELRHQFGVRMPHSKRFRDQEEDSSTTVIFDYGEDAACSPDGKWFGPRQVIGQWQFVDDDGNKIELKLPEGLSFRGARAIWSPDGSHVIVVPVESSNSTGRGAVIEQRKAFVIDFINQRIGAVFEVEGVPKIGNWDYRKGRWNPWSRDGKHLAFIRHGQVWISDPDGRNVRQVTFDASNKVFPTFSPDGSKIAYITWQHDNREHYTRLGPTDIWVVDCKTGLAARVTRADQNRIEGLDWIDRSTLIFDRVSQGEKRSTLRRVSIR